jgi:hypothetical protein
MFLAGGEPETAAPIGDDDSTTIGYFLQLLEKNIITPALPLPAQHDSDDEREGDDRPVTWACHCDDVRSRAAWGARCDRLTQDERDDDDDVTARGGRPSASEADVRYLALSAGAFGKQPAAGHRPRG